MSPHEHAPLTRHEETELARIGQRLRRDGVCLDRVLVRAEWPFQLAAILLAALGGMTVASAVATGERTLLVVELAGGLVLVLVAMAIGVTPARRWVVRTATGIHWRLTGPVDAPAGRCRRRLRRWRARLPGRR